MKRMILSTKKLYLVVIISSLVTTAAQAAEPNSPFAVATGATIGVPAGASLPEGSYFNLSLRATRGGEIVDENGDSTGTSLDTTAIVFGYSYVPGVKLLGGDYRFSATLPVVNVEQTSSGVNTDNSGFGDLTVAPLNLSWSIAPGLFVSTGLAVNIPMEDFNSDLTTANVSTGKRSYSLLLGFSNLRDGWNQSVAASLTAYDENPDTNYKNGTELLLNLTALKSIGDGISIGPVGFWRKQLTDDENNGTLIGGSIEGRAEQIGLGIGFAKHFSAGDVNVNLVKNIKTRNTEDAPVLTINYSTPFGGS